MSDIRGTDDKGNRCVDFVLASDKELNTVTDSIGSGIVVVTPGGTLGFGDNGVRGHESFGDDVVDLS